MKLTVLNDTHCGAIRAGGTTPATAFALRKHVQSEFARLLPNEGDLMILGDLFDTACVPLLDLIEVYSVLSRWLVNHPNCKLYNVAGNHDLAKNTSVMSSFQALGGLLSMNPNYIHIESPMTTPYGYVIPHCRNQTLFDEALAAVPDCEHLFVHVNIDNNFAAQSDHSLNMSQEQIAACPARAIICAHEHHARNVGKVVVPGNQIATSVADWLAPGNKHFLVIEQDFTNTWLIEKHLAQSRAADFEEVDWRVIASATKKFVRVTGTAAAVEASAALDALNGFRKTSDAFVVTNAIQMEGSSIDTEELASSLETIEGFSVMEALRPHFTAEEFTKLEGLQRA